MMYYASAIHLVKITISSVKSYSNFIPNISFKTVDVSLTVDSPNFMGFGHCTLNEGIRTTDKYAVPLSRSDTEKLDSVAFYEKDKKSNV